MPNPDNQYREYEIAAEQQRIIAEIGRITSGSTELSDVFSAFAAQAKKLVPFDRLAISNVDPITGMISDAHISGLRMTKLNYTGPNTLEDSAIPHLVYQDHRTVALDDQEMEELANNDVVVDNRVRIDAGLKSALFVPIVLQGKLVGTLVFRSKLENPYREKEIELAIQISAQIAGVVSTNQQRVLLENEIRNREQVAAEQSLLAEIGRIASSTLDIREVLSSFSKPAKELVPHDRIVIATWSDDGTLLAEQYVDGVEISGRNVDDVIRVPKDEIWKRLHEDQMPWIIRGEEYAVAKDREPLEQERFDAGLRALLIVPLLWQGTMPGSIAFRSKNPEAFDEHEVELAQSIAAQIAGAVASAKQYSLLEQESTERQRLADESQRIAEIGRIVSSTLDINEVFSSFIEQARALLPFHRLVISLVDESAEFFMDVLIDGRSIDDGKPDNQHPIAGDVKEQVIRNNEVLVANDDQFQKVAADFPSENTRFKSGLNSLLIVPLAWQGSVVGTISFRSEEIDGYGEREVEVAQQIAAQIAGAVASSKQYARISEESNQRQLLAFEQARIAEIGRLISSTLDIQEVLGALVDQAKTLVPFDRIAITVANDDFTEVTDLLVDGTEVGPWVVGKPHPFAQNNLQADAISNQQMLVAVGDDYKKLATSNSIEQQRYDAGLRSILMIPMVWQGRSFGSFNLRSVDPNAYGEHEIQLAKQICAQIAGAIGTTNQYFRLREALADVQLQATAMEASDDAIVIRDADTTVVYINSAFERQTGFTRDEVIGRKFRFPEQFDDLEISDNVWAHVSAGNSWRKTVSSTRKDGTEYMVDATLSPIFNEAGKIDKFVGTRRDVSAQVKSNEAIRTQAAALEAAADAVSILNIDSSVEWVNEAFVRDTGYSKEEAIGRKSPFLRSDKVSDERHDEFWIQARAGNTWRDRIWTRRKDGSEYASDNSLTPVFDNDGNISKLVATRRDITDFIQAEQEREARRDLDTQNRQLVEINAQREEFFSTVSHELRTPLTSVMAFADIMSRDREGTLTNVQKEHLDVIKRNSKNLSDLVEDMLDYSQMSSYQLKLDKTEFEIHSLLESVVESLGPTARQRNQILSIEPHTAPVWISADHGRIVQVISNLITNSCKYSPPSTRITLSVFSASGKVSISVSDQGVGIPPGDLENIYSPFFRSSQIEVREEMGTGLGLAISKTLVSLHHGSIGAISELNVGTKITVTLPGASPAPTVNARP
ncbi:GAF domain-containing protein [Dehalococcoides mccartyi]|nr:GAF domain-containing protein [Dehalococcoides mccartyi]